MTAARTPEYRKLALDSSNEMMDYDGDWVLGRYPKAALHIREAGFGRLRMGQIMFDAGDYTQAAADWLSAAACFYLVPDLERMRDAFERVRQIDQVGHIPAERRDIRAAIQEREEQLRTLEEKLNQFRQECSREVISTHNTRQEALDWLLRQVRELPGFPNLHTAIAHQAIRLRQFQFAFKHLEWAEKFAPGNPDLGALRVRLLIASDDPGQAIRIGRDLLKAHPGMNHLRPLLAHTIAFPGGDLGPDWAEAVEILQPLMEDNSADAVGRLLSFALATALRHGLGHEAEYRRLLNSFNRLAEANQSPTERGIVTELRQALPQVFPQPGSNETASAATAQYHPLTEPDRTTLRRVFEPLIRLTAGIAA